MGVQGTSQATHVGAWRRFADMHGQCVPRLRRVILDICGHRSVGGDLLLDIPLFYVQTTPGVGSVNFSTVDFGGAFFNSLYCVPCVFPDTLGLRCTMFMFCVKAALLVKRPFAAYFTPWFSE